MVMHQAHIAGCNEVLCCAKEQIGPSSSVFSGSSIVRTIVGVMMQRDRAL